CNGCQLAGPDGEGYGVWAMRNARGPAVVLGSHGICFAAMVQLACDALVEHAFQKRPPRRAGEGWLAALRAVASGNIDFVSHPLLESVDGDSRIPQATQRQEHLEMFVLLGDPALRFPQMAQDVTFRLEKQVVTPGETLVVRGVLPTRLHRSRVEVRLERTPGS